MLLILCVFRQYPPNLGARGFCTEHPAFLWWQISHIACVVLGPSDDCSLSLANLPRIPDVVRMAIIFVVVLASTVVFTPLKVVTIRLSVQ